MVSEESGQEWLGYPDESSIPGHRNGGVFILNPYLARQNGLEFPSLSNILKWHLIIHTMGKSTGIIWGNIIVFLVLFEQVVHAH